MAESKTLKGKTHFSLEDVEKISKLIEQKLRASTDDQKRIREQIRGLGFYASDFGIGGGYTVEDFKSVIKIGDGVKSRIEGLIKKYKAELRASKLQNEIYKWKLLGEFRGRPDVDAEDFYNEIKSTKFQNLIFHNGIASARHMAKDRSEPFRACFKKLLDENTPLQLRVSKFSQDTLVIYRQLVPDENLSHHQDERSIATYLTYFNPEKYAFYKDSFYQKYCKLLGINSKKSGEKYVHYLDLLNDFRENYVETDSELIGMVNKLIPVDAFKDPTHTLLSQDILRTMLDKSVEEIEIGDARVFKVSMGSLTAEELESCLEESIIIVHSDTKSKGTSAESQAKAFKDSMRIGDYFYLTHGNRESGMKFLGKITSDAQLTMKKFTEVDGWLSRHFEIVATSVNQTRYEGRSKWWTPNSNSTFIEIPEAELQDANTFLFSPYFSARLIPTNHPETPSEPKPVYKATKKLDIPLNLILYGPPGTGKTYRLLKDYYPLFTSYEQDVSDEQRKAELATSHTWWQIVAAVVLDLKSCDVTQILNHPLLQMRHSLSELKNARALAWGILQKHTKNECENVKYSRKQEPLFFDKDNDGTWRIDSKIVDAEAPEVKQLLSDWKQPARKPNEAIKRYEFVTFHQSFSYEDFIEGIKPKLDDDADEGDVQYVRQDGIFKTLCAKARLDPENPYALFIDEINRGNVSQIFGELITLIEDDKREGKLNVQVDLPYSKAKFSVPSNLHVIGTMNTADRSVEALDTALRRRFHFIEMGPLYYLAELQQEVAGFSTGKILARINARLQKLLDKDHLIGHSYFMEVNGDLQKLKKIFQDKIIPLLQEYFYGGTNKIGLVLGPGFFHTPDDSKKVLADFYNEGDDLEDRVVYQLVNLTHMTDQDFGAAIQTLMKE